MPGARRLRKLSRHAPVMGGARWASRRRLAGLPNDGVGSSAPEEGKIDGEVGQRVRRRRERRDARGASKPKQIAGARVASLSPALIRQKGLGSEMRQAQGQWL